MKKVLLPLSALLISACTTTRPGRVENPPSAEDSKVVRILKAEGLTNIVLTGYQFFACSEDDLFHDGFTATKNGVEVSGVVCSGFLKGYTVRYQ